MSQDEARPEQAGAGEAGRAAARPARPASAQARAEARLVRRCAAGDATAWSEFVDTRGSLIRALVRQRLARITGRAPDPDVDDIVANVFLALVRRERVLLHRYDPRWRLSTYLGVICRTEVLRFLRRGRRRPGGLEEAERVPDRATNPGPARALEERERQDRIGGLRDALAGLPERDRLLLTLRYFDGLDYRAIGVALSLNPESVGQFLHRAKRRLARLVPELEAFLEAGPGPEGSA